MSPPIISELFCRRDISYNLTNNSNFPVPNGESVFHGSGSISYLGPKIWDIVPLELKELTSLNAFKKGIKDGNKKCPLQAMYVIRIKSRFHYKYLKNLFLTFTLFLKHFRSKFTSYIP